MANHCYLLNVSRRIDLDTILVRNVLLNIELISKTWKGHDCQQKFQIGLQQNGSAPNRLLYLAEIDHRVAAPIHLIQHLARVLWKQPSDLC